MRGGICNRDEKDIELVISSCINCMKANFYSFALNCRGTELCIFFNDLNRIRLYKIRIFNEEKVYIYDFLARHDSVY